MGVLIHLSFMHACFCIIFPDSFPTQQRWVIPLNIYPFGTELGCWGWRLGWFNLFLNLKKILFLASYLSRIYCSNILWKLRDFAVCHKVFIFILDSILSYFKKSLKRKQELSWHYHGLTFLEYKLCLFFQSLANVLIHNSIFHFATIYFIVFWNSLIL